MSSFKGGVGSIFILAVLLFCLSCSSDTFVPPEGCEERVTYSEVREVLLSGCAQSGCHDGVSGVGDYRSYEGVLDNINNGSFDNEVFVTGSMPPAGFEISQEDFDLLKCWSDNEFPEE